MCVHPITVITLCIQIMSDKHATHGCNPKIMIPFRVLNNLRRTRRSSFVVALISTLKLCYCCRIQCNSAQGEVTICYLTIAVNLTTTALSDFGRFQLLEYNAYIQIKITIQRLAEEIQQGATTAMRDGPRWFT